MSLNTAASDLESPISAIEDILEDARNGRPYILVDAEDRENEGDVIIPAQMATPDMINFMARFARGLICLSITGERAKQLRLPPMAQDNGARNGTAFTVAIEAREGVTTGISAHDRAHTIAVAIDPTKNSADIVSPGHVFPLVARDGGVLVRAGHTEAAVDISRMAGLYPAGVICEIINDDGTMARLPDLLEFAALHGLKIGTIADLIHYRSQNESIVERIAESTMHTVHGPFKAIAYRDKPSGGAHLALVHGEIAPHMETLVRVHQPVSILDLLETQATTHSWNMASAMMAIKSAERGAMVLLNCEESAEQMFSQFAALCSEECAPSRDSRMDLRTYGIGAQILKDLGVGKMKLLASPRKMPSMTGFNLEITGYQAKPDQ